MALPFTHDSMDGYERSLWSRLFEHLERMSDHDNHREHCPNPDGGDALATKRDIWLILEKLKHMAATLDDVLKDVTDESTVIDGISTLLSGLQQQLKDALANAADKAKVDAIFAAAESNKAKLAKALTDNTPAAP